MPKDCQRTLKNKFIYNKNGLLFVGKFVMLDEIPNLTQFNDFIK